MIDLTAIDPHGPEEEPFDVSEDWHKRRRIAARERRLATVARRRVRRAKKRVK
jgi:hypothetical protein